MKILSRFARSLGSQRRRVFGNRWFGQPNQAAQRILNNISTAALCALLLFCVAACQSRVEWDGIYIFSENLGRDPAGAALQVEYRLELTGDSCRLEITGYMSDTRILCTLEPASAHAEVRFRSYDNGAVKNIYGVQVYQVDEGLFTLLLPAGGELVTEWGGLVPDSAGEKSGSYFARQ